MSNCKCCASSSSGLDGARDADRRSETGTLVQMADAQMWRTLSPRYFGHSLFGRHLLWSIRHATFSWRNLFAIFAHYCIRYRARCMRDHSAHYVCTIYIYTIYYLLLWDYRIRDPDTL